MCDAEDNANSEQTAPKDDSQRELTIVRFVDGQPAAPETDVLATESPLEIRVQFFDTDAGKSKNRSLSITMRTPGDDENLSVGFLATEGIIRDSSDVVGFEWTGPVIEGESSSNQLTVVLADHVTLDIADLQRHFYTTSSCGICGKASLDAVRSKIAAPIESNMMIAASVVHALPETLRERQQVFDKTGGLHAAGLFSSDGKLLELKEDVGRHNALDKLLGQQFMDNRELLKKSVVVVSGRTSFELVQKAVAVGVPVLVAVGAPSSLAVELAREFNVTLIGFTSNKRFNVYSHEARITSDQ